MTVQEALQAINAFPIPVNAIETFIVDRALTGTDTYTKTIGESQSYRLAVADTYYYLSDHPNIVEQEVGINNAIAIKKQMLDKANAIYAEYEDPKYTGKGKFGFVGEDYNG